MQPFAGPLVRHSSWHSQVRCNTPCAEAQQKRNKSNYPLGLFGRVEDFRMISTNDFIRPSDRIRLRPDLILLRNNIASSIELCAEYAPYIEQSLHYEAYTACVFEMCGGLSRRSPLIKRPLQERLSSSGRPTMSRPNKHTGSIPEYGSLWLTLQPCVYRLLRP